MSGRVIAGQARGMRLKLVPGDSTRPIMDRVKEALFSIIGTRIQGALFLDLYAGTGAVGIEALSRGAGEVLFIDLNRLAIKTIHENLTHTKLSDRAKVRRADAFELLKTSPEIPFDIIYIAPPQYKGIWSDTLRALEANPQWIPEGTEIIVQIDPREDEAIDLQLLVERDRRRYGKTMLIFYISTAADLMGNNQPADEEG